MKPTFRTFTLLGLLAGVATGMMPAAAQADNAAVENALRNRPDISSFYQALTTTGVIHELRPGMTYTIFAPTNEALAELTADRYPCFYSAQCRPEIADILRNHIVPGQVYVSDVTQRKGAVFSIDRRHINIAEPHKNDFTVEGSEVLSQTQTLGGILYRIDGVIANPQELAAVTNLKYIPVAEVPTTDRVVTERVYYAPSGRPDGVAESTTITTRSYAAPAPVYTTPDGYPAPGYVRTPEGYVRADNYYEAPAYAPPPAYPPYPTAYAPPPAYPPYAPAYAPVTPSR